MVSNRQPFTFMPMVVVAGLQLTSLGELLSFGSIGLRIFSIPVTIFATVGAINAVNMSGGIDGLSGSLMVVAFGFVTLPFFSNGQVVTTKLEPDFGKAPLKLPLGC